MQSPALRISVGLVVKPFIKESTDIFRMPSRSAPSLDVASDQSDRPQRVLDDVGAGQRASEPPGQAETDDSEDLVEALQDAGGHARLNLLQPSGEVAQEPFGLLRVVLLPGLAERLLDACMQVLGQALTVSAPSLVGGPDRVAMRLRGSPSLGMEETPEA